MMRLSSKSNRGFTLIELMIVVAIIGLLAALAIPNFIKFQARSRQSEARSNLKALFTAQKSYYGDKLAYCTALDTIGFSPERGNRYLYTINFAGPLANRTAATETFAGGKALDCGALTGIADANEYETVGDDQWKWKVPAVAYGAGSLVGVTYSANQVGGLVPAAVGIKDNGVVGCPAGQCEFVATAQGNIDNDPTYDNWVISSCGGVSTTYGNFAGGEPINTINDVNL
jgi:type IV pilus assembly protein PilA